jgi:hypothetical protein
LCRVFENDVRRSQETARFKATAACFDVFPQAVKTLQIAMI